MEKVTLTLPQAAPVPLPDYLPETPDNPGPDPQPICWSRAAYYRLAEQGWFQNQRVELINGDIYLMAAMNSPHRISINLTDKILQKVFSEGFFVSVQCPLSIGELSDPEPDVAVIAGDIRDYPDSHPSTAVLVVEVSDTTLGFDRKKKGSLYASAGVPDYWIINLLQRCLEVRRQPVNDSDAPFGWAYADTKIYRKGDTVSPLERPDEVIAVEDLLP
jgi:Uma2 family endonuclease